MSETPSGSPVIEMTAEEYSAFLEREVRHAMGLSAKEFRHAYLAGKLDEADPAVSDLVVDSFALVKTVTHTPRSAAQAFVDHLNAVLNATVSDARLSLLALPGEGDAFEITRFVGAARAPLELLGSSLRLFVRHTIVVLDGHCQTESYGYRLQSDEASGSWCLRWEHSPRFPPR